MDVLYPCKYTGSLSSLFVRDPSQSSARFLIHWCRSCHHESYVVTACYRYSNCWCEEFSINIFHHTVIPIWITLQPVQMNYCIQLYRYTMIYWRKYEKRNELHYVLSVGWASGEMHKAFYTCGILPASNCFVAQRKRIKSRFQTLGRLAQTQYWKSTKLLFSTFKVDFLKVALNGNENAASNARYGHLFHIVKKRSVWFRARS